MTLSTVGTSWLAMIASALLPTAADPALLPPDHLRGFASGLSGYAKTFQPYLATMSGCVPFPAVDAVGNVSAGLPLSGAKNEGCSSSKGQVYVRHARYRGKCAIMYAWYFPKDQSRDGDGSNGHRHDWENVAVWLSECASTATINAVSYSEHGRYKMDTRPPMDGTHPLVAYQQNAADLTHSLAGTSVRGSMQPAVVWDAIPGDARAMLEHHDFDKANVPFNSRNFLNNLAKAYYR